MNGLVKLGLAATAIFLIVRAYQDAKKMALANGTPVQGGSTVIGGVAVPVNANSAPAPAEDPGARDLVAGVRADDSYFKS